jgi:hypothetical protein
VDYDIAAERRRKESLDPKLGLSPLGGGCGVLMPAEAAQAYPIHSQRHQHLIAGWIGASRVSMEATYEEYKACRRSAEDQEDESEEEAKELDGTGGSGYRLEETGSQHADSGAPLVGSEALAEAAGQAL